MNDVTHLKLNGVGTGPRTGVRHGMHANYILKDMLECVQEVHLIIKWQ
jgi:hypothetical protein